MNNEHIVEQTHYLKLLLNLLLLILSGVMEEDKSNENTPEGSRYVISIKKTLYHATAFIEYIF